jgi:hypothetical protein
VCITGRSRALCPRRSASGLPPLPPCQTRRAARAPSSPPLAPLPGPPTSRRTADPGARCPGRADRHGPA